MHSVTDPGRSPNRYLRPLRLIEHGDLWVATAPPVDGGRTELHFAPFVLPRIPGSLVQWLRNGGQRVWLRHGRCMAALLLVDTATAGWTLCLPRQLCGRDAAGWSTVLEDVYGLSDTVRIAGSYQCVTSVAGIEPSDHVPATTPGVHLVDTIKPELGPRDLCTFVLAAEQPRRVPEDSVLANDWSETIESAMPRLRLA